MRSLCSVIDHTLTFTQPKTFTQEWELMFGGERVGYIRFPKMMSSDAEVKTADGNWHMERKGFLQKKIVVKPLGGETIIATYNPSTWTNKGTLDFSDGRKLQVKHNFWKSTLELLSESGEQLIHLHTEGLFSRKTIVTMSRRLSGMKELPVMIMFCLYLTIMNQKDAATAAAA